MPDSATIERQLDRVRRRRNLVELQRALYLLIALAASAAALLVVFALATSSRLFAVMTGSVAAAALASGALILVETRRRWLSRDRSAAWIDRRYALDGRLTTVIAIGGREDHVSAFFLPLLVEQNLRRLTTWQPERVVPRPVPLAALASALAAAGILLTAIALAPGLRPRLPEIVYSDHPVDGVEMDGADGVPDRVVVAPSRPRERGRGRETPVGGSGAADENDSALARLSQALQEQIRRELWGAAWERMRDAAAELAQAAGERPGSADRTRPGRDGLRDGDDDEQGDAWEEARTPGDLGTRQSASGVASGRGWQRRDGAKRAADAASGEDDDGASAPSGADEHAASAGNDTDPAHLFGKPSGRADAGDERFELGIAVPVRARGGASRRAAGEAAPAEPDARPDLGSDQRPDAAVRKIVVPVAYEAIVREVFAHRASSEGARP